MTRGKKDGIEFYSMSQRMQDLCSSIYTSPRGKGMTLAAYFMKLNHLWIRCQLKFHEASYRLYGHSIFMSLLIDGNLKRCKLSYCYLEPIHFCGGAFEFVKLLKLCLMLKLKPTWLEQRDFCQKKPNIQRGRFGTGRKSEAYLR